MMNVSRTPTVPVREVDTGPEGSAWLALVAGIAAFCLVHAVQYVPGVLPTTRNTEIRWAGAGLLAALAAATVAPRRRVPVGILLLLLFLWAAGIVFIGQASLHSDASEVMRGALAGAGLGLVALAAFPARARPAWRAAILTGSVLALVVALAALMAHDGRILAAAPPVVRAEAERLLASKVFARPVAVQWERTGKPFEDFSGVGFWTDGRLPGRDTRMMVQAHVPLERGASPTLSTILLDLTGPDTVGMAPKTMENGPAPGWLVAAGIRPDLAARFRHYDTYEHRTASVGGFYYDASVTETASARTRISMRITFARAVL